MKKKLALLLVLAMILSSIPMNVFGAAASERSYIASENTNANNQGTSWLQTTLYVSVTEFINRMGNTVDNNNNNKIRISLQLGGADFRTPLPWNTGGSPAENGPYKAANGGTGRKFADGVEGVSEAQLLASFMSEGLLKDQKDLKEAWDTAYTDRLTDLQKGIVKRAAPNNPMSSLVRVETWYYVLEGTTATTPPAVIPAKWVVTYDFYLLAQFTLPNNAKGWVYADDGSVVGFIETDGTGKETLTNFIFDLTRNGYSKMNTIFTMLGAKGVTSEFSVTKDVSLPSTYEPEEHEPAGTVTIDPKNPSNWNDYVDSMLKMKLNQMAAEEYATIYI